MQLSIWGKKRIRSKPLESSQVKKKKKSIQVKIKLSTAKQPLQYHVLQPILIPEKSTKTD